MFRRCLCSARSALFVLFVAFAVWIGYRYGLFSFARSPAPDRVDARGESKPGFTDALAQTGINFRMAFLPNEQGERFKVNLYDHGCGVAVSDYDGDGLEDLYFVNQLGSNALYRNQGDGTFADVTGAAGVGLGDRACVGAAFADYDNDGRPDLFVTSTRGGNVLFKNLGDGRFKDVTRAAGLTLVAHCQTATFFDYDNDGLLDLFVTCSAKWTTDQYNQADHYYPGVEQFAQLGVSRKEHNVLYHNNGNGTFTDVTAKAGLQGKGWAGDVTTFDFDGDGRVDLSVTNMFGRCQLYRNNGDGTFRDMALTALGRTPWGAIGSRALDFDNDGRLDLFIVDMHSDMWFPPLPYGNDKARAFVMANEKARYAGVSGAIKELFNPDFAMQKESDFAERFHIEYDKVVFGNVLLKNLGGGKFQEVTVKAQVETFWPWGIATGDFNNDGFEDIFLPSGMGYPFIYWPNRLLLNQGNGSFAERSGEEGIEPPARGMYRKEKVGGIKAARSSRCAVVADFRNAGRMDLVTNNFNDAPYFFRNQFPQKNFIAFRLRGTSWASAKQRLKTSRDAIGALIKVFAGDQIMTRQVSGAGGYLSQSSLRAHFGLGDRSSVDRVEIRWPSGILQQLDRPALNQVHDLVEPAG